MENNMNQPMGETPSVPPTKKWSTGKVICVVLGAIVLIVVAKFLFLYFVVVAPRLDEAKTRGTVASVKADLSILKSQGDLYGDSNDGSYSGVCRSHMFISMFTGMLPKTVDNDVVCYDNDTTYAVGATVQDLDGIKTICVNNMGVLGTLSGKATDVVTSAGFSCR